MNHNVHLSPDRYDTLKTYFIKQDARNRKPLSTASEGLQAEMARMVQFGRFIRAARRCRHLSRRDLAIASGISDEVLLALEQGLIPVDEIPQTWFLALAAPLGEEVETMRLMFGGRPDPVAPFKADRRGGFWAWVGLGNGHMQKLGGTGAGISVSLQPTFTLFYASLVILFFFLLPLPFLMIENRTAPIESTRPLIIKHGDFEYVTDGHRHISSHSYTISQPEASIHAGLSLPQTGIAVPPLSPAPAQKSTPFPLQRSTQVADFF